MFANNAFLRNSCVRILTIPLIFSGMAANATPPAWWGDGSPPAVDATITDPDKNHGMVNVGQAKWMARCALTALHAKNPGTADAVESQLVGTGKPILSWDAPVSAEDKLKQRQPLLIGQLKAIAAPFYLELYKSNSNWLDRESSIGTDGQLQLNGTKQQGSPVNFYPWSHSTGDDANKAPATIGQVKAVFSLRFETLPPAFVDLDGDEMDDLWELSHGLDMNYWDDVNSDDDGDYLWNGLEYQLDFDPWDATTYGTVSDRAYDRDGDGIPDYVEYQYQTWELDVLGNWTQQRTLNWEKADGTADYDNDGLSNYDELYVHHTSPVNPDTDGDDMNDGAEVLAGRSPTVIDVPQALVDLAAALSAEINSRLLALTSVTDMSMPLYSNTSARWTSTTFVPNTDCWLHDLRPQLTGIHMSAGAWTQSYGIIPITRRHCLSTGHNGPGVGETLRYVKDDGTVFQTKILKWINDGTGPGAIGRSSDPVQPYVTDLSVYLLEDPLPIWVNIAPIFPQISSFYRNQLAALKVPHVAFSQGNVVQGPGTAFTDQQLTPYNRKAYVFGGTTGNATLDARRSLFYHGVSVGDSGTPAYFLINNTLYLDQIISGDIVGNRIPYINSLILRADVAAGISTGYSISAAPMPSY